MIKDTDIAWLAGIVDGEGCFSMKRQVRRRYGGWTCYQVWLVICNTNKPMIDRAVEIVARLGLRRPSVRRVWKGAKATRWQYWMNICRKDDLLTITKALIPHLTAKRPEAEIVAWFLTRACAEKAYKRTPLDIAVLDSLSKIKANGGEAPMELAWLHEVIPCQADGGLRKDEPSEGVQTRGVTPKNNLPHECPTPFLRVMR